MLGLPLAFTAPAVLSALILLPAIWWLLRLTPPRPRLEAFPPTRILLELARKDETPARSPWWLTALRLLLAALVILALAGPVFRPVAETAPGGGPLLLVLDNGWAAARRWDATVDTARRIVGLADEAGRPVTLLATAEGTGQALEPAAAGDVLARLDALAPRPYPPDRAALQPALATIAAEAGFGGVAWLSDGLGGDDAEGFARFLAASVPADTVVYDDGATPLLGLKPPTADAEALTVPVIRRDGDAGPAAGLVRAADMRGRVIGEAPFDFAADAAAAEARFALPAELRNDIVRLEISGADTAGTVQLLDERWRRRAIGLLSGAAADTAQPLLSPLYYISRAVQPFADIREPDEANVAIAVPELIQSGVSVIAMADIGTMTPEVEDAVAAWVAEGGTLIRFAGPRLAASTDRLIPVRLRQGGRVLGGSLSWETPQPLASFAAGSPFDGLAVPADVTVQRQVLAEPDGDLAGRTWAALADGTPLVTAAPSGKGWLILFHVTADTSWSNLPLSGTFVEMLRRIVAFSHAAADRGSEAAGEPALLPPYRLLDGHGRLALPGPEARPVPAAGALPPATAQHPPGLYGAEDGFRSLNLLDEASTLPGLDTAPLAGAARLAYPTEAPTELSPWLVAGALLLLILDALAVLWLGGALGRRPRRAAAAALAGLGLALALMPRELRADEAADAFALKGANETHLAYVITGNDAIDAESEAGLAGLSRVLTDRTALEPAEPIGVDVARDELAFFPLLYWPIDPDAPLPSSATMARVDAYMKEGGSILFDTRDELERGGAQSFSGTPAAEKLRAMLANLDIPPLEPVPPDHVLTKAFYLLEDFPGRYSGGPLWVEQSSAAAADEAVDRPARAGDGVTSILITSNELAGAWAIDGSGTFLYPTVPADPRQREMAFRVGVNIVMYTLTGNYKADQVHVPALLERLGQ